MVIRHRLKRAIAAGGLVALGACSSHPPVPARTGHPGHARSAQALPSPSAAPLVTLTDDAAQARCPSAAPRGAECFRIEVSGTSTILGHVTSGGWLDIEVPTDSQKCGKTMHYREHVVTSRGWLTVHVQGPRLCLGAVGTTQYTYSIESAGGDLRALSGTGKIMLSVQDVGATEVWTQPTP